MTDKPDIQTVLKERFAELPKVVQNAITSEDNLKHLRELGERHKLHIDQWETLENEVMMTLFGVTPVDELQMNIKKHVGVSDEIAVALTEDISKIVFQPIRDELERQLEHPDAKAVEMSRIEGVRAQELAAPLPPPRPVIAATPPPAPPVGRIERAPVSAAYKAGEASTVRKSIEDDPYRESPT